MKSVCENHLYELVEGVYRTLLRYLVFSIAGLIELKAVLTAETKKFIPS